MAKKPEPRKEPQSKKLDPLFENSAFQQLETRGDTVILNYFVNELQDHKLKMGGLVKNKEQNSVSFPIMSFHIEDEAEKVRVYRIARDVLNPIQDHLQKKHPEMNITCNLEPKRGGPELIVIAN